MLGLGGYETFIYIMLYIFTIEKKNIYIYICKGDIYIYIERERERDRVIQSPSENGNVTYAYGSEY